MPTKPDPHVLYVAPTTARARALDRAGYNALVAPDLSPETVALLSSFTGTDLVLTVPLLHPLAAALNPDRFHIVCVDCWPGSRLDVVGTVPAYTHLLSLAERQDVVPVKSSAHGRLARAMFQALDDDNEPRYRELARQVVAA